MKWKDKQKLPSDVCNTCGKPKPGSNSNSRHLCGKCYLKEAKARRKEKEWKKRWKNLKGLK